MKQTVARVSEDELTLEQWEFVLCRFGEHDIAFRLTHFRRWHRDYPGDEYPWNGPPSEWCHVDLFGKNTIKEPPEIPESVMSEARQWILSKIIFEEP
jgi:hypothetical protein